MTSDQSELTERDRAMLEFEHLRWAYPGARETAVREQFGMSLVRYSQILNNLIDRPAALAADPTLVRRLIRLRDQRRRARSFHRTSPAGGSTIQR